MTIRLSRIDLNLLRSLDALLRERSVTRAAEQSNVTQQAMSGSLKRLREHFGDPLLQRIGLRLELTPLGVALLEPVRMAMLQIEAAFLTTPGFDPATSRRRFRIALSDYAVTSFLPHLVARLAAGAPGISIEVSDMTSAAFSNLESGDLEFSMQPSSWRRRHEDVPAGVRSAPLFDDEFACAVDRTVHRFEKMTRERYVELPHVVTRLQGWGTTAIADVWNREAIRPRIALVAPGFTSALLALPGTPLVATVQRALIRKLARSLPISVFDCPFQIEPLHQELYWHARFEADPTHNFMREQFALAGQDVTDATV